MSVNPVDVQQLAAKYTTISAATEALQKGELSKENFQALISFKRKDDAFYAGLQVEQNPESQELTQEQKEAKDKAKAQQEAEVAQMKAASNDNTITHLKENGVQTERGVITSHGNGTAYTFDIKAPTKEQSKTSKADERARMARYYDEVSGEWIEVSEDKTIKEVRAELKEKLKELKADKKQVKKDLKATNKELKKANENLISLRAKVCKGTASQAELDEAEERVRELTAKASELAEQRDEAAEEYSQANQAYKASKGRGIGGDTRAYNKNVKANNRLVNREVYFSEAEAKEAKSDPANKGKTIKVATTKDLMVLQQLSATALRHVSEESSPNEKALWQELAGIFKDENGDDIPLSQVDTRKVQDALIDLTGGDMRLNYTEQKIISKETGMSMSDVRHAFRTYGFEAPHPIGKRLVNGLVAAAPVAASMGLGYLLSKNKAGAQAHSESTAEDHAYADASQTTIVNGEVTATASTPGYKFDWTDPYTGEEIHKRIAGATESVTEYYEAVATATAHAEAHSKAFASATAACEAVATLSPAALIAAPALAFLAGAAKAPVEISAAKAGVTTQKMATYVDVFKKNKNKNIGNQIIQMAGQITGDKAVDRALIVAVLDHDIGSQNTTPTTRELRSALAHLDAIKVEVDKFKKLPPAPPTEPPTEQPTVGPTETPTETPTECPVEYIHTWFDEETHCQPIKLRVINGMSPVYPSAVRYGYNNPDGTPVTDAKTLNKIQAELKRLSGERAGIQSMPGHGSTISAPLHLTIDGKTYTFDCENAKARIENSPNGIPRRGRGRDVNYYKIGDSYYKQDCNDPVPVPISKDEYKKNQ